MLTILKHYGKKFLIMKNKFKRLDKPVYVTNPLLPDINDFISEIETIYNSRWLTNMGEKHNNFEVELQHIVKVKNVSVFNNGTIALLVALKALDFPPNSEIITTPFTFAATAHCIAWNNLKPVFCDIEPQTMCIDANKIEALINSNTSAILGVHVYGFPCNVKKINEIAKKYNLKVIYDAAHAFSVEIDNVGIGNFGDISMFSFHATKLFNSIEGGCLTYTDDGLNRRIYNLRNFGIQNEELVEDIGINGKMNEFQAAFGLLNLKLFEKEKEARLKIRDFYLEKISKIKGIRIPQPPNNTTPSLQYFPIIVEDSYKLSRNELYDEFKKLNIYTRKYFYPICSDYICYKNLPSSSENNLPVANDLKNKVLCLPFYGSLDDKTIRMITEIIHDCSVN